MSDAGRCFCPKCKAPNTGPSCSCGVAYITAGEVAERRLRADPYDGDALIAKEEGIADMTVTRKRAELEATGTIVVVEKTRGVDGRWYKVNRERKIKPKSEITKEQRDAAAIDYLDNGKTQKELAKELGCSEQIIKTAVDREEGRREALADPQIDAALLSKTAQEKLNAAIRQHEKHLESQFEDRVQSEIQRRLKEMVYPRLQEKEKDAARIIKSHRGVFKIAEYNAILRCLHPDMMPDNQQKAEAFQLWHDNKVVLVSQKEDAKQYPSLPSLDELMVRRGKAN